MAMSLCSSPWFFWKFPIFSLTKDGLKFIISAYANLCILLFNMESLVQFFRALAEETRLRIVMLLLQGELCVCDLMSILNEPQSKISRHLAYLKHSGIVSSRRAGLWVRYSLKEPLEEGYRTQLNLMRKKFASLPQFQMDAAKLLKVKKHSVCKAIDVSKVAYLAKNSSSKRKRATFS